MSIPRVLTIAGSDSSGGAGIQADLKTFSALECYGMSAITALTAQNTEGVNGIYEVEADFVALQLKSLFDDIKVDAVKIGMAGSAEIIDVIAKKLKNYDGPVVLDPVMVAQSGDRLIEPQAAKALKEKLVPLATVITPNLPEAGILLGHDVTDPMEAAKELLNTGADAVLLKGGHGAGQVAMDVLAHGGDLDVFEAPRLETKNTHGTGCTLSAALACFLAQGKDLKAAVGEAKSYITKALEHADALEIGKGAGPVHHFHDVWS